MLTDDQIKTRIENAFPHMRCVAEIWDYGQKLRFKVFDENESGIVEVPAVVLRDVRNEQDLENLLQEIRDRIFSTPCAADTYDVLSNQRGEE